MHQVKATPVRFHVVKRLLNGTFAGIVSGMGRNAGTWDSDHSRSAAYKHAADCRKDDQQHTYHVEPTT